jgi:mRNA interferase MazF
MTRGKVVLVPFPFDDLSATKVRPAVCLTEPVGDHRHVVLAFVSSRIPSPLLDSDVVLQPEAHAETGLRVESVLRLHRLMTVSTEIIRRELGSIPKVVWADVEQRLRNLFELGAPSAPASVSPPPEPSAH